MDRAHRTPLLRTKLHRPPVPRDMVPRGRLLSELDQGSPRALILLSAPAGYGKTTLVSHWLESSRTSSAWISLDETDSDVRTFLRYVVEAVRPLLPDTAEDVSRLLDTASLPPPEARGRSRRDGRRSPDRLLLGILPNTARNSCERT